ncbi:hypothetical protein SanaruYs_10290 [Chryseotalea sanaruensis]|uniref:Uncharacterized protein n=1 Tax=Chryseotalea sanaruensis TaxID=2482724 RepID=A0A401U7E0_9BACT|nr:hypothetical protein SanaruYs_10290 [Chryseotalea sanaruensis]
MLGEEAIYLGEFKAASWIASPDFIGRSNDESSYFEIGFSMNHNTYAETIRYLRGLRVKRMSTLS